MSTENLEGVPRISTPSDFPPLSPEIGTGPVPELTPPDGSPDADKFAAPEPDTLPPAADLVNLLGATPLVEALRDSGLERQVFLGFRPGAKALSQPVVRKRLEDSLSTPGFLDHLSRRWTRSASGLQRELDHLDEDRESEALPGLVERFGPGRVRWALLLHPRPDLKPLAAELAGIVEQDTIKEIRTGDRLQKPDTRVSQTIGGKTAAENTPRSGEHRIAEEKTEAPGAAPDQGTEAQLLSQLEEAHQQTAALMGRIADLELAAARDRKRDQERVALAAELEEAKGKAGRAGRDTEELRRRLQLAEDQAQSNARQATRLQQRLEEANQKIQRVEKAARRAERPGAPASDGNLTSSKSSSPQPQPDPSAAARIIESLLSKERFDAVIEYAREAWAMNAADDRARDWLLTALRGAGRKDEIAVLYYDLAMRAIQEGSRPDAVAALCESILAAPENEEAAWRMEKLLQTADPASRGDLEQVARLYGDLKRQSADAAATFESLARRLRRSIWRRLPSYVTEEHRRLGVVWPGSVDGEPLTASELAAAVASGDLGLVDRFRRWTAAERGESRQTALQVIRGAQAHLPGAYRVLTGPTHPVLVDGSNVAWSERSKDSGADLENIRHLRQKLWEEGYFPVIVLADAALPWQVKDPDRLRRWQLRGEIRLVEGRTDADETLLAEARRLDCPIVTNDRMRDLDPEERAVRIGYSLGPGGVTLRQEAG